MVIGSFYFFEKKTYLPTIIHAIIRETISIFQMSSNIEFELLY